jgi:hypothetical protein
LTVVVGFVFGWRDVSDRLEDPVVVEPVDPLQRGVFDVVESPPGSTSVDDLDAVALALNTWPRKTLEWRTPAEALTEYLQSPQQGSVATTP